MRPPVDRELRRRREIAVGFLVFGLFVGWVSVGLLTHASNVEVPRADEPYRWLLGVTGLALSLANLMAMRFTLIREQRRAVQIVAAIDAFVLGPVGWAFGIATLYVMHRERIVTWLRRRSLASA